MFWSRDNLNVVQLLDSVSDPEDSTVVDLRTASSVSLGQTWLRLVEMQHACALEVKKVYRNGMPDESVYIQHREMMRKPYD